MQLICLVVLLAIFLLLLWLTDIFLFMFFPQCLKNLYRSLKAKIFWNSALRTMIESYLPVCMSTFLALQKGNKWDSFENVANSLASFIFIPFIIGYPIWIIRFMRRNRFLLSDRTFMSKYSSLYLNVDYFKFRGVMLFQPIFLARRCIFSFNAVFLGNFSYSALVQLQVSLWAS